MKKQERTRIKAREYIEMLNNGNSPKVCRNMKFSDGSSVGNFWLNHGEYIKFLLENSSEYKDGYVVAKKMVMSKMELCIEELNSGYIPKSTDRKKLINGEYFNSYFSDNSYKIEKELNTNPKYSKGYDVAKEYFLPKTLVRTREFIERINNGYVPRTNDMVAKFSDGTLIRNFYIKHREDIERKLFGDSAYNKGYETAKRLLMGKLAETIEELNSGYIPEYSDTKKTFVNGENFISYFTKNKAAIEKELYTNPKYNEGYEVVKSYFEPKVLAKARQFVKKVKEGYGKESWDKLKFKDGMFFSTFYEIHKDIVENLLLKLDSDVKKNESKILVRAKEFIEAVNNGYIPRTNDRVTKFSDGTLFVSFYNLHKEEVKELLLNDPSYINNYERAKKAIIGKVFECILELNNGYKPKPSDREKTFVDGKKFYYYFSKNRALIEKELHTNSLYNKGYDVAKDYFKPKAFSRVKEFIEMINNGYIPTSSADKITRFSDGTLVVHFYREHKKDIVKVLLNDPMYDTGYEIAKEVMGDTSVNMFGKIDKIIKIFNQGIDVSKKKNDISFNNGHSAYAFFKRNSSLIRQRLFHSPKYSEGYDVAKRLVDCEYHDKITEYIEILNSGYNPKCNETTREFNSGTKIKNFWYSNFIKIIDLLFNSSLYSNGYENAKEVVKDTIGYRLYECIELLNNGENYAELINFSLENRSKIIKMLDNPKYRKGYERAKEILKKDFVVSNNDDFSLVIDILNKGIDLNKNDNIVLLDNGKVANYIFCSNKALIIELLNSNSKYKDGYEVAKKVVSCKNLDKIFEIIEVINNGNSWNNSEFTSKENFDEFWSFNFVEIIDVLFSFPVFKDYVTAKNFVKNTKYYNIYECIEFLNNGKYDSVLSNGIKAKVYVENCRSIIVNVLNTNSKYMSGYSGIREFLLPNIDYKKTTFLENSVFEYIEFLNNGYFPKSKDLNNTFKDGRLINNFWPKHKKEIIVELFSNPRFDNGYDEAKGLLISLNNSSSVRNHLNSLRQMKSTISSSREIVNILVKSI